MISLFRGVHQVIEHRPQSVLLALGRRGCGHSQKSAEKSTTFSLLGYRYIKSQILP